MKTIMDRMVRMKLGVLVVSTILLVGAWSVVGEVHSTREDRVVLSSSGSVSERDIDFFWENAGVLAGFMLMPPHCEGCSDYGIVEVEDTVRTPPKALKFYMLGPHLTNTTLSIAVRRNLKHPSEPDLPLLPSEIWVSQWRYVPRIPNEPLSWNTLGKYWSAVTNELGQKVDLQIHIAALDGRGWLAGRVRTVNLVTGEVVEYHSWRGGEWHYDEWFRVMVGIKRDRVDGWIKWYYNDQLLSEVSGIPTIIGNDAKVWPYFSDYLTLYPETHPEQIHDIVTYMDDIVISDSYIPLDYGVLSSQG